VQRSSTPLAWAKPASQSPNRYECCNCGIHMTEFCLQFDRCPFCGWDSLSDGNYSPQLSNKLIRRLIGAAAQPRG
jgi:predicted ATP-dependent serine protease